MVGIGVARLRTLALRILYSRAVLLALCAAGLIMVAGDWLGLW